MTDVPPPLRNSSISQLMKYFHRDKIQEMTRDLIDQYVILPSETASLHFILNEMIKKTGSPFLIQRYEKQITFLYKTSVDNKEIRLLRAPKLKEVDKITLTDLYRNAVSKFLENTHIFSYDIKDTFGELSPVNYVMMMLLIIVTNYRTGADRLRVLMLTGNSSVGKSSLLNGLLSTCANIASDSEGVAKYKKQRNNVTAFHFADFTLSNLLNATHASPFKTISRGEKSSVKVRGSVEELSPTFIIVTSNNVLFRASDSIYAYPPDKSALRMNCKIHDDVVLLEKKGWLDTEAIRRRSIEVRTYRRAEIDEEFFKYNYNYQVSVAALYYLTLQTLIERHKDIGTIGNQNIIYYALNSLAKIDVTDYFNKNDLEYIDENTKRLKTLYESIYKVLDLP